MEFIKSNIYEIKKSSSLAILGVALSVAQLFQAYVWMTSTNSPLVFSAQTTSMCWPIFSSCNWAHWASPGIISGIFWLYVIATVLALVFFLFTRAAGVGASLFWVSTLTGFLLYLQDFRLSSNPGFFTFFLSFLFLLIPSKIFSFRWIIFSLYLSQALLKLNSDWLSGGWVLAQFHVPDKFGEWISGLSTLIEFIAPATLLMRDGRYFWSGWLTLFFYHVLLMSVGVHQMSALFLGLLVFLGFADWEERKLEREYIYQSFIRPEPSRIWPAVVLLIFWFCQGSRYFQIFNHEPRLNSSINLLVPYPMTVMEECELLAWKVSKQGWEEFQLEPNTGRAESMVCHPYLQFLDLKSACELSAKESEDFVTIAAIFKSRRSFDSESKIHFQTSNLCDPALQFSNIGQNSWNSKQEH